MKADTYPAVQECYLRAMSVEQFALPDGIHYFSPLRWLLAIMLELEKRTGTSELSRIEFALWGHTTNPSYNLSEVVDSILDLRKRRAAAPAKRPFDKKEIAERGKNYDKKADNFLDYSDMNMRYLRISGVLQRISVASDALTDGGNDKKCDLDLCGSGYRRGCSCPRIHEANPKGSESCTG